MTNSATEPNNFLKAFYWETFLINGACLFGAQSITADSAGKIVPAIIGTYNWWDTTFATHKPIQLPEHTKKALLRVMVPEGTIAPKHPAFLSMDGSSAFEYEDNGDGTYINNMSTNPKATALLDGSEIEIFGIDEIRKIIVINQLQITKPDTSIVKYNADPINFYLNITLFK